MATCKSCGADIVWVEIVGPSGIKLHPLNAEPDPTGNIIRNANGEWTYERKGHEVAPDWTRFTSHFAICPEAASFRRKGVRS